MRLSLIAVTLLMPLNLSAQGVYSLRADGNTDTYELIEQSGYFTETSAMQSPDDFMMHPEFRHISQVYDDALDQYVFAFDIHVDYDESGELVTDGNKSELIDRQRNEIKCMDNVPGTVAKEGETITYKWKFRLPEDMKTSGEFCHIHQIKGMGSGPEVAHPVFTLTCRTTSSKQVLQVINVPFEGSSNVNLAQIDLKQLLGRWIEAEETLTVGRNGSYALTLTDIESSKQIVAVNKSDIAIWRDTDDQSTMRAKWGIYRSLGSDLSLKSKLRSERVLFADFETSKGPASVDGIFVDMPDRNDALYDLTGRRVMNPGPGIYIRNGKKILIK